MKLLRDGAGQSAMARVNGAPSLVVIASAETVDNLIKRFSDQRIDLREGQADKLLMGLGAVASYKNFIFVIDPYPRRFTYSGGTYTQVAAFSAEAATKGNKTEINSSWETADYEETFIFDPEVMTQLVPAPKATVASNFPFDPVKYTGEWQVKNIIDRECNPDGTILYHRGTLAASSMPRYPERGVAIVHQRCDPQITVTSCT